MPRTDQGYRGRFFREPIAEDLKAIMETERARPLHDEYHRFDKAHVVMLTERGLIPREAGAAILGALLELERGSVAVVRESTGGGAHAGERYVTAHQGPDVAGHIHLGRSTGDLTATAVRLRLRRQLLATTATLLAARKACLDAAHRHRATVLAGYTHGQQTQPVTLGHMLAALELALARDAARLSEAFGRADRSPAGSVIMAGSDVAIDRDRVADLLGFGAVDENTYDAVLAQDVLWEAAWVLAVTSADVARAAEDLMFLSTTEIGIVAIPDRFSGTSSVAVHKRNPYATQVMKGAAAAALGTLTTAFATEKGPTGMAMQDRLFTLRALWAGFDDLIRDLGWLAEIVRDLEVDAARARRLAEEHWATSTDVASLLVRVAGMPWRTAHQVVGVFVRDLQARGVGPDAARPTDLSAAAREVTGERISVSAAALRDALSASAFVRRRTTPGGPAPAEVARQVSAQRERLAADGATVATIQTSLEEADRRLAAAVRAVVDGAGPGR